MTEVRPARNDAAGVTRRAVLFVAALCLAAPALGSCHKHQASDKAAPAKQSGKDRYADGKALAQHLAGAKSRWSRPPKLPDCSKLLDASQVSLCAQAGKAEAELGRLVASGASPAKLLDATGKLALAMADATHALRLAAMGYLGKHEGDAGRGRSGSPYLEPMQRYYFVTNGTLQYLLVFLQFGPLDTRRKAFETFERFWHAHPEWTATRNLLEAAARREQDAALEQRILDLAQHPPALSPGKAR
jgi:hypothetical protein